MTSFGCLLAVIALTGAHAGSPIEVLAYTDIKEAYRNGRAIDSTRRRALHVCGEEIEIEEYTGDVDLEVVSLCSDDQGDGGKTRQVKRVLIHNVVCDYKDYGNHSSVSKTILPASGFILHNVGASAEDADAGYNSSCTFVTGPTPCKFEEGQSGAIIGANLHSFDSLDQRETYCDRLAAALHVQAESAMVLRSNPSVETALLSDNDHAGSFMVQQLQTRNSWTHGGKSVLVYLVSYEDNPGAPMTATQAATRMETVSGMMKEFSYGKTWFSNVVIVPETLEMPEQLVSRTDACMKAMSLARTYARARGFETKDYDLDVVFFKYRDCGGMHAGFANIGAKAVWINWNEARADYWTTSVVAHEFGHASAPYLVSAPAPPAHPDL